jgi:hypothetical protein
MTRIFSLFGFFCLFGLGVCGQTSSFTYQGKLVDNTFPANGTYQMQFSLHSAVAGTGNQIGSTITNDSVTVTNGVFTVQLDFAAPNAFDGSARWLEIAVRRSSPDPFTVLIPRQPLTSSPYAIKASASATADSLSAVCVLCITDGHVLSIDGSKITGTVANATTAANISGIVPIVNGGTGSSTKNFIDLSTNQTVVGNKNFVQTTTLNGANITTLTSTASATFNGSVAFNNANPVTVSGVLDVSGAVSAEQFLGSGEGLTNVPGNSLNDGSVTRPKLAYGATSKYDPQIVATLRWDLLVQKTFTLTPAIFRAAFDGTHIWVTDGNGSNVTKLRASDGFNMGSFPVGSGPFHHIAFDGANIWVSNRGSNNVTKLRANDGANLGTFPVGTSPLGIAFDGTNIWVANSGSNNLTKLRASDGANLGTFAVTNPRGVAFDGTDIWVASTSGQVRRIRITDGAIVDTYNIVNVGEIVSDGTNMWVNRSDGNVAKFKTTDGSIVGTFPIGGFADGLGFDGTHIWVASNSGFVRKLRASDGGDLGSFPVASPGTGVTGGVLFDGTHIWVVLSNGLPAAL